MNQSVALDFLLIIQVSLQKTGSARFRVVSNSMLPVIRNGDWVEVAVMNENASLKIGDIILYRRPSDFLLHRVVKMNNNLLWTKGDRNRMIDVPIKRSEVLAKLIKIQKNNTWFDMDNPLIDIIHRSIGKISYHLLR
jgi:signal peptidase I